MPGTEVYILGQKYTIRGDSSPEHIHMLSKYMDERIKEVCGKYPNITPLQAMILTSFNIADELHKVQALQTEITGDIELKANELEGLLKGS